MIKWQTHEVRVWSLVLEVSLFLWFSKLLLWLGASPWFVVVLLLLLLSHSLSQLVLGVVDFAISVLEDCDVPVVITALVRFVILGCFSYWFGLHF